MKLMLCGSRFHIFMITVWLSFGAQWALGQLSPADVIARVGETVTLTSLVTTHVLSVTWYRGTEVKDDQRIIYYVAISGSKDNGPQYTGRETVRADGSLQIRDVLKNYTGTYTVNVAHTSGAPQTARRQLRVYEILTPPTLTNTTAYEFVGDNVTLRCQDGTQTVDRYIFSLDNLHDPCRENHITCNDRGFMHFHHIKESDNGSYTCTIHNPISNSTSAPLQIKVKHVPISNVTISSNFTTGGLLWEYEDYVQLSCTALGTDPAVSWMFNGSALPQDPRYHLSPDNASLTISPVTRKDTGAFLCRASNRISSQSSQPLSLDITWRPNGPIQCGTNTIGDKVLFSCSWAGGNPPASVQLQYSQINKTGSNIVMGNISWSEITLGMTQTCHGNQEGLVQNCYVLLDIPQTPPGFHNSSVYAFAQGADVQLELNLKMSNRASSVEILSATFSWFDNSSSLIEPGGRFNVSSKEFSSKLTISKSTEADSGHYVCEAKNLMGATRFSYEVNVSRVPEPATTTSAPAPTESKPPGTSGGLSPGAIAGITIGVVAVLVLIGVIIYCVMKNKKAKQLPKASRNAGGHASEESKYDTVIPNSEEPRYETIIPNSDKKRGQMYVGEVIGMKEEPRYETIIPNSDKKRGHMYVGEVIGMKEEPKYDTIIPNSDKKRGHMYVGEVIGMKEESKYETIIPNPGLVKQHRPGLYIKRA